jgi:uncharacterized protein YndB with AHSA1/START domain
MNLENDIISSRLISASAGDVFAAFADPQVLEKWWGPNGFTNKVTKFEFHPGGVWEITMRGPDGTEYPNVSRFTEIVPNERIVYDHIEPVHAFSMTMTFDGKEGGCLLTWIMNFVTPGEAERLGTFIASANEQNFDRLEAAMRSNSVSS